MNPLLSSQNLFVLKTVDPKKPDKSKLMVINELDGFFNSMENQRAVNAFGEKELSREERAKYAREMLISMIGKEEFLRLKESFKKSEQRKVARKCRFMSLDKAEQTIFKLIAKGFTQKEIAELLDWSNHKVLDHKKSIYHKMNFEKKSDLLEFANKNQMI